MGTCTISLERGRVDSHKSAAGYVDNDWLTVVWVAGGETTTRTWQVSDLQGHTEIADGSELAPFADSLDRADDVPVVVTATIMNLSSVDRDHQVDVATAFARDLAVEVEKAYMTAAKITLLALGVLTAPEVAALTLPAAALDIAAAGVDVLERFEDEIHKATRALFDDVLGPLVGKVVETIWHVLGGQPDCNGPVLSDAFFFAANQDRAEWIRDRAYPGVQDNEFCGLPPHTTLTWWLGRDVEPHYPALGHEHVPGQIWALTPRMWHQPGHPSSDHLTHDLLWYNHLGIATSEFSWDGPRKLGNTWEFSQVLPGVDGCLYAIDTNGTIHWYRNRRYRDGVADWLVRSEVGHDFRVPIRRPTPDDFVGVFCDTRMDAPGDWLVDWQHHHVPVPGPIDWQHHHFPAPGPAPDPAPGDVSTHQVVYAIKPDGQLLWYAHEGYATGTGKWANGGQGVRLSGQWVDGVRRVFSGGLGVIYVIRDDGTMRWFRHTGSSTGADTWVGGHEIHHDDWRPMTNVFSVGAGIIYAIDADGVLWWYQHRGWYDGAIDWTERRHVGDGWNRNGFLVVANSVDVTPRPDL
jgi:hypothetical protein